jgi:tetratricopeptide (TPR) repeat protein
MPIRRPRGPKPVLRHLPFLELMAGAPEGESLYVGSQASLLSLRLLDHWIALGAELADVAATAHRAARESVQAMTTDVEWRTSLSSIIDAIEAIQEPDAQPVLPRVYALAMLLEQRGLLAAAGDVYATVAKYVDSAAHLDLAYDAHMRHGYCLRHAGEFDWADQAYANAGMLAARDRDRVRVVLSRLGRAKVVWDRGDLPAADAAIMELLDEAESLDSAATKALILHDRSGLAWVRNDYDSAIRWVFEAFKISPDEYDRERMLGDLAGFLGAYGAHGPARTALRILEQSARTQGGRWSARINLMELGARTGSAMVFEQHRRELANEPLPPAMRVNYLIEVGRGQMAFGAYAEARATLLEGMQLATSSGFNRASFVAESLLKELDVAERRQVRAEEVTAVEAPADISAELDRLLLEVSGSAA